MRYACLLFAGVAVFIAACSAGGTTTRGLILTANHRLPVVALPGYDITIFAPNNDSKPIATNPDSIAVDGEHVFIDYQNVTAKDCTDEKTSTVIEYNLQGKMLNHWTVAGHSDGMRIDPSTHLVWTTSCEDGNPKFATIDPTSGTVTPYTFPPTPHGGGYDDLYFLNGSAFVAASNPSLDKDGSNPNPAIDKIALGANDKLTLTPVLKGNATAADLLSNNSTAPLTLTDPDSLSVDSKGQLVLVSQGDSELVFVSSPGTPQQKVSKMAVGTQLEDTVWP